MRNPVNAQSYYSVARTVADLFLFSARVFLFTSIKSRMQRGNFTPKIRKSLDRTNAQVQNTPNNNFAELSEYHIDGIF